MNKIEFNSETLKSALNFLKSTIGPETAQNGEHCLFMDVFNKNGVECFTTNGIEFTQLTIACTVLEIDKNTSSFPSVNFRRLRGLVSTFPAGQVIQITDEGGTLNIYLTSKKKPFVIKPCSFPAIYYPPANFKAKSKVALSSNELSNVLRHCSKVYKKTEAFQIYNCMELKLAAGSNNSTVCDVCAVRDDGVKSYYASIPVGTSVKSTKAAYALIDIPSLEGVSSMFAIYDEILIEPDAKFTKISGIAKQKNASNIIPGADFIENVTYYQRTQTGIFPPIKDLFMNKPSNKDEALISIDELLTVTKQISAIADAKKGARNGFNLAVIGDTVTIQHESVYGQIDTVISSTQTLQSDKFICAKLNSSELLSILNALKADGASSVAFGENTKKPGLIIMRSELDTSHSFQILSLENKAERAFVKKEMEKRQKTLVVNNTPDEPAKEEVTKEESVVPATEPDTTPNAEAEAAVTSTAIDPEDLNRFAVGDDED